MRWVAGYSRECGMAIAMSPRARPLSCAGGGCCFSSQGKNSKSECFNCKRSGLMVLWRKSLWCACFRAGLEAAGDYVCCGVECNTAISNAVAWPQAPMATGAEGWPVPACDGDIGERPAVTLEERIGRLEASLPPCNAVLTLSQAMPAARSRAGQLARPAARKRQQAQMPQRASGSRRRAHSNSERGAPVARALGWPRPRRTDASS